MFDVTTTMSLMSFAAAIFYFLGRADGLNVGRVKTNELVRDAARTLQNTVDMLTDSHTRPLEIKGYLYRNIRRLQDGEKLE